MRILPFLLPGSLTSSFLTSTTCLASCCLILLAQPRTIVPLFILSAASFGMHIPVLVMLATDSVKKRLHDWNTEEDAKLRGVHVSGNQLGLTMAHGGIWLGIVVVFVADIAHSFRPPVALSCPSHQCGLYTLAVTLAYLHFFFIATQLLGFALVIYEVQSAPRRVLANRSLNHVLKKSVSQLISIREEVRRVRALGGFEPRSPSVHEHGAYLRETAGTLARAESAISLPSMLRDEEQGRRRRTRTISATTSTSARLQEQLTLDEVIPVVVHAHAPSDAVGAELERLRSAYRSQVDNGRYPLPLSSDGITVIPRSQQGAIDFSRPSGVRFTILHPSEVEPSIDYLGTPTKDSTRGLPPPQLHSPAFSPESRYSNNEDPEFTPKSARRNLSHAELDHTPVTPGPFASRDADAASTPRQEQLVTPTK